MRVGVGGLLTPDGCIGVWRYLEWSPATYRLRSLRSLRLVPASCWFGLWVESWVGLWFL